MNFKKLLHHIGCHSDTCRVFNPFPMALDKPMCQVTRRKARYSKQQKKLQAAYRRIYRDE